MVVFVVENKTRDEPEFLTIIAEDEDQIYYLAMDTLDKQFPDALSFERDNNKIIVDRPNEEQQTYSLRPLGGDSIVVRASEIITNL